MKSVFNNNKFIYLILGLIIFVHVSIFTKLIYFPYPEFFIYPYLTNNGLKPYSQILDQHFPGLMFFAINLDNLGMNTPDIARVWSMIIVVVLHLMIFIIGKEIFKSKIKALLANGLFLIWNPFFEGWVFWIDSFLPIFLLPAFYALYKNKFFITGLLLGLGVIFKQTVIPLSVFILIYVLWKTRSLKKVSEALLGLFIPISAMLLYVIYIGVLKDFWYWTITYNLTTYAQFGLKTPPSSGYVTRIVLIFGFGFFALMNKIKAITLPLFIFLVGSLVGAFERADFVHLQPALPFVIFATVFAFENLSNLGKIVKWGVRFAYVLVILWWLNIFYSGHIGNRVITFDSDTINLSYKIKEHTKSGEKIFLFGVQPHLYQMTKTLPAGDIFVFQFPWFLKIAEQRILQGLINDKPNIVISDRSAIIEDQKISDYAKNISEYIYRNYKVIDKLGTADILQKI